MQLYTSINVIGTGKWIKWAHKISTLLHHNPFKRKFIPLMNTLRSITLQLTETKYQIAVGPRIFNVLSS